ncbi:leucyl aminopeptidase [Citricoccus muralis]|uniref:leucyl aminopeptidase n=1 Tax=Citricoccus muralis TaxID=169134 RepID=UPI0032423909
MTTASTPTFITTTGPTLNAVAEVPAVQALVLATESTSDGPRLVESSVLTQEETQRITDLLPALGVRGAADEVLRIPASAESNYDVMVLAGVGSKDRPAQGTPAVDGSPEGEIAVENLRRAAGSAVRSLAGLKSVAFAFPADTAERLAAITEGAAIAAYSFTAFRSTNSSKDASTNEADTDAASQTENAGSAQSPVAEIFVVSDLEAVTAADIVRRAETVAQAVRVTRDFVNTPPSHLFPASLADAAVDLVKDLDIETTVWDEKRLAEEGFGGILGIGQGSSRPPRLVRMAYSPADAQGHIALVGKGITFDTGGISLKPAASMMTMKSDMTGAATVTAVVAAVARLQFPIKVTGWLAVAENMPSATAIRPSDVLTTFGGKTVEVLNTDAEGRVVMADALVAACQEKPDAVIDIATLTGAQMVALGNRTTGVMGQDALREELVTAGQTSGESIWPMPIPANQRASLDSSVADISNMGDRFGGMLTAAAFLREFVGDTPWAHLDIAGPSFNESSAWGYTPKDATGVMVRTLLTFLSQRAGITA